MFISEGVGYSILYAIGEKRTKTQWYDSHSLFSSVMNRQKILLAKGITMCCIEESISGFLLLKVHNENEPVCQLKRYLMICKDSTALFSSGFSLANPHSWKKGKTYSLKLEKWMEALSAQREWNAWHPFIIILLLMSLLSLSLHIFKWLIPDQRT